MAANDVIPFHDPADAITCRAEAAVEGKRFVSISGPRVNGLPQVSKSGAGAVIFGVAMRDKAAGADVGVIGTGIVPVIAGAAIAAGDLIASDAAGEAVPIGAATHYAGVAVDDAADGAEVPVKLSPGATA